MIETKEFYESLNKNGIDFYTGVPDSLLKDICSYISDNLTQKNMLLVQMKEDLLVLQLVIIWLLEKPL